MSNHTSPVPAYITKDYIAEFLRNHWAESTVVVEDLSFTPGSAVGDNYCCQIWRIKTVLNVNSNKRDLSIIAKVTPLQTKTLDSIGELFDVFEIESSLFASTLPTMAKYLKNTPNFAPECYYVDVPNKVIFMEDLGTSGYQLQPRGKFLNKKQSLLVMEALATFHGTSYYAVQNDPSLTEKYNKTFWNGEINDMSRKFFGNSQKCLEKFVDSYGVSEETKKKLLSFEERAFGPEMKILMKKEGDLNFLLHGDCWMNNMLFHYAEDGNADKVKLIDYQITYHGSFANDLHYFLTSSAEADVVINDLDELLRTYYNKLKEVAPDIPNLKFKRIQKEFAERHFFGLCLAICFRSFIVSQVPVDMDKVLDGVIDEMGFGDPRYISDLKKFVVYYEKVGLL